MPGTLSLSQVGQHPGIRTSTPKSDTRHRSPARKVNPMPSNPTQSHSPQKHLFSAPNCRLIPPNLYPYLRSVAEAAEAGKRLPVGTPERLIVNRSGPLIVPGSLHRVSPPAAQKTACATVLLASPCRAIACSQNRPSPQKLCNCAAQPPGFLVPSFPWPINPCF